MKTFVKAAEITGKMSLLTEINILQLLGFLMQQRHQIEQLGKVSDRFMLGHVLLLLLSKLPK